MRFKRALAALLVALLGATGSLVVASPASAHVVAGCQDGWFCTYRDVNWGGGFYAYSTPIWSCINIGPAWDNQTSGIHNNRTFVVSLWTEPGCSGIQLQEDAINGFWAHYDDDIHGWPSYFGDVASSISFGW